MKSDYLASVEETARSLQRAGYGGDLSDFVGGLHDIHSCIESIRKSFPQMLSLPLDERQDRTQLLTDWIVDLEHIAKDAGEAAEVVRK